MRLDRFLSQSTGLSRSQVRALIRQGRVRVNGERRKDAALQVATAATVTLDDRVLQLPQALYLMLHKPRGLLSATRDDRQATVMTLLPEDLAGRVHLVGRLDKDTSGLLLLSDDGQWSHRISAPRRHCPKVYAAELAERLVEDAEARLAAGISLRGESRPCAPARLERLAGPRVRITVTDGRYHLVRRMVAALGNRVVPLHRERIGGLALDPTLAPGEWRTLTAGEREAVFSDAPAHRENPG